MRHALIVLLLLFAHLGQAQSPTLPAPLEPWRDWVLQAHPELPCPQLQGLNQRMCAWPGRFEFQVDQRRARFSGNVQTYARTQVLLPGSSTQWPEQVQVDGKAVPVGPGPGIWLPAGSWQIAGVIEFERRPEELNLPPAYALLDLQLDGQLVQQPRRTPRGLWLGRVETESGPMADSLSVEVYRLLSDGAPPTLRTVVRLNVAGRAREQRLGGVLPEHFEFTEIRSPLNARLDGNDLLLQLRPGSFELEVSARATQPLGEVTPRVATAPWPEEEIWSYAANPALQESSASGATPIDPTQADVPEAWRAYASFLLGPQQSLQIDRGTRGIALDAPNRLTLERRLWLSFDAQRWIAKDRINGTMRSGWRLDAQPPFALTRANSQGEPVLVTRQEQRTGVELRSPYVNVEAGAEAAYGGALPATGWASDFESASLRLELPPGWRLLHLGGADRTSETWLGQFTLLHAGGLLLVAVLAWRLGGLLLALALTLVGVLGRGEAAEPSLVLVVVLLLIALLVRLPSGRKRHLGTLAGWVLLLAATLSCLPFVLQQSRLAVFPQYERLDLSGARPPSVELRLGQLTASEGSAMHDAEPVVAQTRALAMAPPPPPPPPPAPASPMMESNVLSKAGSGDQSRARNNLERYSAGTNLQAGKAEPDWRWNGHVASFDGRVGADAELRPWLLSPTMNMLWRLLAVAAALTSLMLLAGQLRRRGSLPCGRNWLWLSASLLCVGNLHAAELPDEAWLQRIEQHLLQAEPCRASGCTSVPRASVRVQDGQLQVVLDLHAQALTALPVPELAERSWDAVRGDGRERALLNHQGHTWLVLPAGIHQILLEARVDRSTQQRLRFRQLPARISCQAQGYACSGITDARLQSDTLELVPEASGAAPGSTANPGAGARSTIAPFVRIERDFSFELDWEIQTTVTRIAPQSGGLTVRIPLIEGERLLTEGLEDIDGAVAVSLRSGENSISFSSKLAPVSAIELKAAPWNQYVETWRLRPGPAWRLDYSGVPAVEPAATNNEWVHSFHPLPGEVLQLQLERPAAAAGSTLAIDQLRLRTNAGARQRDSVLSLNLRATQGGQHQLELPAAAELTGMRIDGRPVNLRLSEGLLKFPVRPGAQSLQVEFREKLPPEFRQAMPAVNVHTSASNVNLELAPAAERWLLWVQGPVLGPALGFWLLLAGAVLVVLALHWTALLPGLLGLGSGLLLALGTVLLGWWVLPLILLLAALLTLQQRHGKQLQGWASSSLLLVTVATALLSVLAVALRWLAAIGTAPNLHIGGLHATSSQLNWFADLSEGQLPAVVVWSAPLWVYQVVLLLWGAWLVWLLYRWLGGGLRRSMNSWNARRQAAAESVDSPQGRM